MASKVALMTITNTLTHYFVLTKLQHAKQMQRLYHDYKNIRLAHIIGIGISMIIQTYIERMQHLRVNCTKLSHLRLGLHKIT